MAAQAQVGTRRDGGLYVVVLRLEGRTLTLRVGALGPRRFEPGFYAYVGSARRALQARMARHRRPGAKRLRWHVDYLRERACFAGALWWPTHRPLECRLSRTVERLSGGRVVAGFGASDCRCAGHLFWFERDPLPLLRRIVLPGRPPVRAHEQGHRSPPAAAGPRALARQSGLG